MSKWYVECDCKTHLIGVETWDNMVCMSFFEMGHCCDGRISLKGKWHLIKQILKKGHPYMDSVIFQKRTVDEFIGVLCEARTEILAYEEEEKREKEKHD